MTRKNLFSVAPIFIVILFFNCVDKKSEPIETTVTNEPTTEELITRGEYLTKTIGCDHCHTPKKMTPNGPVPDTDRWLMGHPANDTLPAIVTEALGPDKWLLFNNSLTAAVGPWGVSFSANITPDDTGIGSWSYDQFKIAMTKGKYKGMENGRPLMPPMPWESYVDMKEEDMMAIFEYLKSIKPIENVVPSYIPPAPVN
ncbi:diheme cytochrome c-553 [Mangrovimonas futianensis]|uniref:diheme cytochrome c-553 n=1 Tax=Mangrovimonas futianensis TaxID=2895523 RepID=UPI001E46666A|nr:diheme cytochrome c-553 [Mangrovimonas futianensis]MCF1422298.1 diheme cytochrome c-553 [Mangrovimonas futianensis]